MIRRALWLSRLFSMGCQAGLGRMMRNRRIRAFPRWDLMISKREWSGFIKKQKTLDEERRKLAFLAAE
jgi:hypothetical protein